MTTGIVVFAHGSRVESANEAVRAVAKDLVRLYGCKHVLAAFLELGVPDLPSAADLLVAEGADRLVIVPYFLTAGLHIDRDLPPLVERIVQTHPQVEVTVTRPLDGHPALVEILADRAGLSVRHSDQA